MNGFETTPAHAVLPNGADLMMFDLLVQTPPPRTFFPLGQTASFPEVSKPGASNETVTISYPLRPLGPGGPCGPAGPVSPLSPLSPFGPTGPCGPAGPVSPFGPFWLRSSWVSPGLHLSAG